MQSVLRRWFCFCRSAGYCCFHCFFFVFFYLFFIWGGGGVLVLYCTILTVIFSLNFAIISLRTRGLVALLCVCFCPVAVIDLSLFLAVS